MIAITLRNTRESRYLGEQMRPIIPGAFPSCVIFDDKEMLRLQGTSEINRDKVADGLEGIKKTYVRSPRCCCSGGQLDAPRDTRLINDLSCFSLLYSNCIQTRAVSFCFIAPTAGKRFEIANDSVMKRSVNKQTDSNFPPLIEMEMRGSIFYRGLTNVQRRNFKGSEELLFLQQCTTLSFCLISLFECNFFFLLFFQCIEGDDRNELLSRLFVSLNVFFWKKDMTMNGDNF